MHKLKKYVHFFCRKISIYGKKVLTLQSELERNTIK